MAVIYLIIAFALCWLLAVFKVFVLDDGNYNILFHPDAAVSAHASQNVLLQKPVRLLKTDVISFTSQRKKFPRVMGSSHNEGPLSSEWMFIRSDANYKIEPSPANVHSLVDSSAVTNAVSTSASGLIAASELKWPPVQNDGKIASNEGTETMPLIGLKVPRFWEPPMGVDLNNIGRKVNGEETIFLMIASYRDFQCRETITSAYLRADHPERLFVGAVDQVVPGDTGCLDIDIPCSQDPSQMICKYRDQISVYTMDAQYATGPVTARHIGDRMYRGEHFVMQMDAHCLFINHWDTKIIDQFRSTKNEMAVLRY
jgi:hypothetical protein